MKMTFTLLQGFSAGRGSYHSPTKLLMVFFLSQLFFLPTSVFAAEENSKLSYTKRTSIMVTTAKYKEAVAFFHQLQQSLVAPHWNAQSASTEIQVCAEQLLLTNEQTEMLELDQFDSAAGTLTEVEVIIESTTLATIEKKAIWGAEYMVGLNSILNYTLPASQPDTMRIHATYEKEVRTTEMQQNGFSDSLEKAMEKRRLITQFDAFQGQGKVQIPIQAASLMDFEDAESNLNSDLKVKVCINYRFN